MPRFRGIGITSLLPEARFVTGEEFDFVNPLRALPCVQLRRDHAAWAAVFLRQRRAFPGVHEQHVFFDRAIEDDVLLVHTWEGRPLPHEHGGPVRMITPKLYAWKGTKWIRKIEFLAEDHLGFWEVRGYSNSAEPWFNDRYSTGE